MKNSLVIYIFCLCSIFGALRTARGQASLIDPSFLVGVGANGAANSILLQSDGKILVGGEFTVIAGHTNSCLARLENNGQIDKSFAADTDGTVWRLLEQPDGKILVAGEFTSLQGVECYHLGRLLTNGLVDPDFQGGTNFVDDDGIFTIALQPDGKILAASFDYNSYTFRLLRLNTNGTPDVTFASDISFGEIVHAILVRADGNIWVGGAFNWVNYQPFPGCAVFEPDGQLATNLVSDFTFNSDVFSFNELPNGNILVGGLLQLTNANTTKYLIQMTPQGKWDTNFVPPAFDNGTSPTDFITSVVVQPDGKIVAGGSFYDVGGYWRRQIVRLDSQGHVDPCFDPGLGLIGFDWAQTIVRQPDGRILVGGRFPSTELNGPANIERLLPSGDCDATRVYLRSVPENNAYFVAGTYPPGGTNFLQFSTNLVDWANIDMTTGSYLFHSFPATDTSATPSAFFRVKKVY
ncbi:MAG: hypothetical protein PHY43_07365 [Verrucomicrobiales bacterium]|nr:hypothetical protein [Verrucomicrobiales bacterium]